MGKEIYGKVRAFYNRNATVYAKRRREMTHLRSYEESIVRHLPPQPRGAVKILDVGTAMARDVEMLLRHGYDAYGIDFSSASIAQAKQLNPSLQDRLSEGDIRNLQYWHGQLRGIWDNATFHHIPAIDAASVLQQYRQALTTDDYGVLFSRQREGRTEGLVKRREGFAVGTTFFKLYQEDELRALVESQGFRVLESGVAPNPRNINFVWLFARLD